MNKTRIARTLAAGVLACGSAGVAASGIGNHAPVDDAAVAAPGGSVTIDVLANDPGVTAATVLRVQRQPAHGNATVSARQVVYTPAPGFSGSDSFTYTVKTGRSFGLATVTVAVVDGLTISGRVTANGPAPTALAGARGRLRAAAGSTATVVAHVGNQTFQAQAGPDGRYEIQVTGMPGDIVRLESSASSVALASIAGSYGRLLGEAGADGVLVREENNGVQLTPVSAAMAYLLQLANGGDPVDEEAELDVAHAAIDTDAVLQMAAAIKLVADGDYALPAGVPDTMALISDTAAYNQFLGTVYSDDPDAINGAIAATLADPEIVVPATAGDLLGGRALVSSSTPGTIRVGLLEGEHLRLEADGSGHFIDTTPALDPGLGWVLDGPATRVSFDTPRVTESTYYIGSQPVRRIDTFHGLDVTRVVDGGGSGPDLLAVTRHVTVSYPDDPSMPDQTHARPWTQLAYADAAGTAFAASEFPSVRALPIHRPENSTDGGGERGQGYALHSFNAGGTGTVLDDGQAFTWSLPGDGSLQLAYDDGESSNVRRIRDDGRKGEGVIARFQLPGGASKAHGTLSSVRDGSLVFSAANLANPWRSGFDVSQPAYDFVGFGGFYLVLEAGGSGYQVSVDDHTTSSVPMRWNLEGGVMVVRRYRSNQGMQPWCEVGVDGCHVWQMRRWVPVSRDGDRIYVHEELWLETGLASPTGLELASQRANFYDIEAPPVP